VSKTAKLGDEMRKTMVNLGIHQLKNYLANRYPYLLIDKATEIIPGSSAKGYKNMTANEWFFPVHFPEEPMMPGMVQMEALLQMLSLTVLTMDGNQGLVVRGIAANKIRLKRRVTPGCRLDIEAELISLEAGVAVGRAQGYIDGNEVCSGEFTFKLVEPSDNKTDMEEVDNNDE